MEVHRRFRRNTALNFWVKEYVKHAKIKLRGSRFL
jgi:hypothetical protein